MLLCLSSAINYWYNRKLSNTIIPKLKIMKFIYDYLTRSPVGECNTYRCHDVFIPK